MTTIIQLLNRMMSKNEITLMFFLIICSCNSKAQEIESCNEYYNQGKIIECLKCTKDYLNTTPEDLPAMILNSTCAQTKEELEEIEAYMKKRYTKYKSNIMYWVAMGDISMRLAEFQRAYLNYLVAKKIDSTHLGINYKLALSDYSYILYKPKINIVTPQSKQNEMEKLNVALEYINKELSNTPDDSLSLFLKLDILIALDKDDAADNLISIVEKKYPNEYLYYKKGLVKIGLKEYKSAIGAFDKTISLNPNNFIYYSFRGDAFRDQGSFKEAFENYKKALSFDKKNKGMYIPILDLAYKMKDQETFCKVYYDYKSHVDNYDFINFENKYKNYQLNCE